MFKKIILILALIFMIVLPVFSQTGNYTTNKYFYLPEYGAYGKDEYNEYNLYMEKADNQIETNKGNIANIDLSLYYLKNEINTQGEVETIWGVTLATDTELAALKFTDLADTPATYDNGKYAKSTAGGVVWDIPTGAGDMLKATYDTDADNDIDVAAGGTEKSAWTLYCIPYLSGTTAFGEIPIGTIGQVLKVATGATGYEFGDETGGTTVFTGLTDTPSDYTGEEGKTLRVNSTPNAVEFANDTNITTKTGTCTLTVAEQGTILVSASAPYTIYLPTAVGNKGLTYHFIKTDANYNLITLDGYGTETLNYENSTGTPNLTYGRLNTYCAEATLVSDNANWQVMDEALGQVPECRVSLSATQENLVDNTATLIELDTEQYDIGSNFNTTTHYFTSPVSGKYISNCNIAFTSVVADTRYFITIGTPAVSQFTLAYHASFTGALYGAGGDILDLSKDDTIGLVGKSASGDNAVDVAGGQTYYTFISIRLLSKD